ncbi:MAG: DUF1553 domain-containing protein [Gemmataceae bacterium]
MSWSGARGATPSDGVEFFEKKVRPVLVEHCYKCHSTEHKKNRGGLQVDSRAALLKGGESGAALVPGKPEESLLIKALDHRGDLKMPPGAPLPAAVVADLKAWVKMGAPAPDASAQVTKGTDWNEARRFWSFQPVRRPALPTVKRADWVKNDIDRFILARLETEGLTPVAAADRRTLIRRVTFDLTGLPPTPAEVEAFEADRDPRAYARVVDRLLASPRYGERWARHWLDVARYAEDQAHTFGVKPNTQAWRYRDWVIGALNEDMPYDRFVTLQVAADLVADARLEDRAALGFFGLGAVYYKNSNAAQVIAEELDDRVDTLSRGLLGLTVSCARCHDHKYDPVPTQDYYSLAGVFHSSKLADVPLAQKDVVTRFEQAQKVASEADKALKEFLKAERVRQAEGQADQLARYLTAAWKARARKGDVARLARDEKLDPAVLDRMAKLLAPGSNMGKNLPALVTWRRMAPTHDEAEVARLARELQEQATAALQKKAPTDRKKMDPALVQVFFGENGVFSPTEKDVPARMTPEARSKHQQMQRLAEEKKKQVPPAPAMAHGIVEANPQDMKVYLRGNPARPGPVAPRRFLRVLAGDEPALFKQGSGRLDLARAIASAENPLTARVLVNRVWHHHFGRGLVGTPSNFGALGERPTHPELLDWLASEFVRQGWSLKALHRLVVLSATYQLAGLPDEINQRKDPDNRLLWRMNRRRLDVESWRDALLSVTGRLDVQMGGPTQSLTDGNNVRRTVYARVSRHELDGLLRLFDFPDANITSEKRTETTVPQQQLFVLNSPFILQRARELATRLRETKSDDAGRIDLAYRLCYGRPPLEAEADLGRAYLAGADTVPTGKNQLSRLERYAQVLLGSNEFLYID